MREILLTRGLVALVDDEDYEELSKHKWYLDRKGYAVRKIKHPSKLGATVTLRMHRHLLGLAYGDPRYGDHADNNRLNNTRKNLRICTIAQNLRNSVRRSDNTSGFKGVSLRKSNQKWEARITYVGRLIRLGCFDNPKDAHAAYCEAKQKMRDGSANIRPESRARVKPNKTGYTGVKKIQGCDRWEAYIKMGGKKKYLGSFPSPEAAHDAYCKAVQVRREGVTNAELAAA